MMNLYTKTADKGAPLVLLHGGMGSVNHWHRSFAVSAQHYTAPAAGATVNRLMLDFLQ